MGITSVSSLAASSGSWSTSATIASTSRGSVVSARRSSVGWSRVREGSSRPTGHRPASPSCLCEPPPRRPRPWSARSGRSARPRPRPAARPWPGGRSPGRELDEVPGTRDRREAHSVTLAPVALSMTAGRQFRVTAAPTVPAPASWPRRTCAPWWAATTRSCARTSGRRSRRSPSTGAGLSSCSAPGGASRRSTSSPPPSCGPGGAGPTVIVSPLLALMRNQIAAAERAGIRAVTINSTNIEQWQPIHDAIAAGEVDVLLVSPERLNNPGFRDEVLPRLAATCGLLVVDEAHCISDWGHDFRPDYRRIRTLLADLPDGIPVLATTATANARVTADVAEQLGGGGLTSTGADSDVLVLRGSLDRESLRLGVVRLKTAEQRLAWLADHLAEQPGSGIVYCLTVAATQQIADYLRSRGHEVAAYSGQTDPTERLALEEDLLAGRVKALVATSALGMGFDATLGFVVNLGAPASPVAYYQQVGRAGRGTDEASVVLLPAIEDRDIWALLRLAGLPARGAGPADPGRARRRRTAAEHGQPRDPRRAEPHPPRDHAQGARRRRRLPPGQGRLGGHGRGVGLRRRALPAGGRGARARAAGDARLPPHRPVPDVVPARPARRPRGRPTAAAATTAAGSTWPPTSRGRPSRPPPRGSRARASSIEPRKMWPTALAELGIDLKGKIAGPAVRGARRRPAHRPRLRRAAA